MAEKRTHKQTARKAAGKKGRTEVPISRGRRLDAATRSRAIEVETSGKADRLGKAARRLGASRRAQRTLIVPQRDMTKAQEAMKKVGVGGTVRNISGTQRKVVRTSRAKRGGRSRSTSKR